jgi:vitamin B12 transporter
MFKSVTSVFSLTLLISNLAPSCAQAVTPESPPSATDIIVRARLKPFRGDQAFSSVTVRQNDIAAAPSLDEALKSAAQSSLFRRSSSLTANPTVQGLSLRSIAPSGAGRALITLEGIPQNDPFGGWVIWASLPQDGIGLARIVRGAGGGAYGAGALTGVVDLSLKAQREPSVSGYLALSEDGDQAARLSLTQRGFGLYVGTETRYGDAVIREGRGAADRGTFGRDHQALFHYERPLCETCATVSILGGTFKSRRDSPLLGAGATSEGRQLGLSLTQTPSPNRLGYRLQGWYKSSDLSNRSVAINANRASTNLTNTQFATPAYGVGFNGALRRETLGGEWELGFDARHNKGEVREDFRYVLGNPTRNRLAGGETLMVGIYGQATHQMGPLFLTGALRLDHLKNQNGHRLETDLSTQTVLLDQYLKSERATLVSARLGAAMKTQEITWRAGVYNGFRPPSLNELYRPFRVGNDVTEANSALKPEKLWGGELGLDIDSPKGQFKVTVFYNILKDPITNVTLGFGPGLFGPAGFIPQGGTLRQRQNQGQIKALGLEMSGFYRLTEPLSLSTSLTLSDAEVKKAATAALNGNRPAQVPDYMASVGLTYRTTKHILSADLRLTGKAYEDDLNRLRLSPAEQIDLRYEYSLRPKVKLGVRIDNAFDTPLEIAKSGEGILSYDNRREIRVFMRYTVD